MVPGGLMRIDGGAEDLLMHERAEEEGGMPAAGPHGGAAERDDTVRQPMAAEGDGDVEALPT
jgi:hypothetical protein